MLFLGIDQHARQLTVSLRDQSGDVVQGAVPHEVAKPIRKRIEVKPYIGDLVKSFKRKAA